MEKVVDQMPEGNQGAGQEAQIITSKITSETEAWKGKWIKMIYQNFTVGNVQIQNYECVERTTPKFNGKLDGITIFPILVSQKHNYQKLVAIIQYRPPASSLILELPAGLLESQDFYQNGIRELKEETGYTAKSQLKLSQSEVAGIDDPSICSSMDAVKIVEIDADDPVNENPQNDLEQAENIRIVLIDLDEQIFDNIQKIAQEENCIIHNKVLYFAMGYIFSSQFK